MPVPVLHQLFMRAREAGLNDAEALASFVADLVCREPEEPGQKRAGQTFRSAEIAEASDAFLKEALPVYQALLIC